MKNLRIVKIQRGCIYDGPGIRTVVFLKGCNLRCPWCCNPESQSFEEEYFVPESNCFEYKYSNATVCSRCERLGGIEPVEKCRIINRNPVSKDYSTSQLVSQLLTDVNLFFDSGGGVTFSGGEPLLYMEELLPSIQVLKNNGVSIFFETSLVCPDTAISSAISVADGFIVDLKLQPELGLVSNNEYSSMVRGVVQEVKERGIDITFRLVFVDSLIGVEEDVASFLDFAGINEFQLLKCHNMAAQKYAKLGRKSRDFSPSTENLLKFSKYFNVTDILC